MRFCSRRRCLLLSALAGVSIHVAANPALSEQDLAIIDQSKNIIEQAGDDTDAKAVIADSWVDDRMKEELMDIRRHADRLNQAVKDQSHRLIQQDTSQQYIDFDELEQLAQDNPTNYTVQPHELGQNRISTAGELAVPVSINDDQTRGNDLLDEPNYTKEPGQRAPNKVLWIFVSTSMPELQMKKALQIAAEWGGRVIYKGLRPEDKNINDMMRGMIEMKKRLHSAQESMRSEAETMKQLSVIDTAGIYIDPLAFERFQVNEVPTMVYERSRFDGSKFYGKVKGLVSANFLQSETEYAMADPDHKENVLSLGEMSQVYGVVERSFVEESKERMRKIDWRKEQESAVERYWQKHRFVELPSSDTDKEYEFDPSVVVTQDVVATNGVVLARAGDMINPLKPFKGEDIVPVHTTMFVFDATDDKEVAFVKAMMTSQSKGQIKLLATRIDKERGFEHLAELNRYFVYDVKLITQDIIDRFLLKATPTRLMSTNDGVFQVNEYSQDSVFKNAFDFNQVQTTSPTQ